MSIAIGDVLGEYEVIGELGAGGIGKVYKVRHSISHRVEALKFLRPDQLEHPDMADRFVKEIRVLASLNHPNIASLHTAFRHGDVLLMTMELVEGETLSQKLRRGSVETWAGLNYIAQVLQALMYAHEMGVIHRDIKPSNIMISPGEKAKLLDFGLAVSALDAERSRTGSIVGSLHYMSPEQVRGQKVDARSDLYAVGVTLYEILTGRLPITGATQYEIMDGHLRQLPVPPREINSSIPADLAGLVMWALHKDPTVRVPSASDFLRELDAIRLDKTITIPAPATPTSASLANAATIRTVVSDTPRPTPLPMYSTPGNDTTHQVPTQPGEGYEAPRPPSGVKPKSDSSSISGHPPEVIDKISRELAQFVGPIARILVKKAAKQSSNTRDIYDKVALEIESVSDRQKFLSHKPRA